MNNIEEECLYNSREDADNVEPFDPKAVDIISKTMVISNIIERLKYDEIDLNPDFQRHSNLWDDQKQSRLIESLIIKIPLPTFYFDGDDEEHLIVIDGLQRLSAIKRFAALEKESKDRLKLTGLEYLQEYNECYYEDLPANIRRRINEQTIVAYIIRPGTPEKVRTSIFTRINTGGLMLQPAEIKNSVYRGQAADLLKELAAMEIFKKVTRYKIDSSRMLDCEFVNRFLAFYILGTEKYKGNLEDYLNDALITIKYAEQYEIAEYRNAFVKAMNYAYDLFGEVAFRRLNVNEKYGQINKPLFDAVSVNLAKLNEKKYEILYERKEQLLNEYRKVLKDEKFLKIISNGTARIENVKERHNKIFNLFEGIIKND